MDAGIKSVTLDGLVQVAAEKWAEESQARNDERAQLFAGTVEALKVLVVDNDLVSLLGLQGEPVLPLGPAYGDSISWEGLTAIEGHEVISRLTTAPYRAAYDFADVGFRNGRSGTVPVSLMLGRECVAENKAKIGKSAFGFAHDLRQVVEEAERTAAKARLVAAAREKAKAAAEQLKTLAGNYMAWCAGHEEAAQAWAQRWTAELWAPWGGWLVRYAPVGKVAVNDSWSELETVFVLDELTAVIAQSPGAPVRVADAWNGAVRDLVIGAFVDATPIEWTKPEIRKGLGYHEGFAVDVLNGRFVVNVPAGQDKSKVHALVADAPQFVTWVSYMSESLGLKAGVSLAWGLPGLAEVLDGSIEDLAALVAVQKLQERNENNDLTPALSSGEGEKQTVSA